MQLLATIELLAVCLSVVQCIGTQNAVQQNWCHLTASRSGSASSWCHEPRGSKRILVAMPSAGFLDRITLCLPVVLTLSDQSEGIVIVQYSAVYTKP